MRGGKLPRMIIAPYGFFASVPTESGPASGRLSYRVRRLLIPMAALGSKTVPLFRTNVPFLESGPCPPPSQRGQCPLLLESAHSHHWMARAPQKSCPPLDLDRM